MADKEIKQKVKKLREQIRDLRYRYHVENDPEVTDAMYEGLMDELKQIEEEHPELVTEDSPTQRVVGEPADDFDKVEHLVEQHSFNDAFDKQDMLDWEERMMKRLEKELGERPDDMNYTAELKIDGIHIVLTYKNGRLVTGATRGDGEVGEDITRNIKTIHSIPLKIDEKETMVVEGEAWMSEKTLEEINERRKEDGKAEFANPRNAAAGTLRQLDPKVVARRNLSFTAYDITYGPTPDTQEEGLKKLENLGFPTEEDWEVCDGIDEIMDTYNKWVDREKTGKPFWIDGLVVKVNQKRYQDILGYVGKGPRWAIALKFPAEQGTTEIKDVYWQVGRTGRLTPVALLEEVDLAGTTVTHATLHNYDEIQELGVKVGDQVVVEKAGDIIPQVVRVLEKMRDGDEQKIEEPKECPICDSEVKREELKTEEESADLFCTNPDCYAKELESIKHFVSQDAFDIEGLGEKIVKQLLDEGLIKDAADIFTLKRGDLEPLERFAEKAADNLVTAIDDSKEISLPRFLYALGIEHVGDETAYLLSENFGNLEKIKKASREELEEIDDIGPRVSQSIVEFFNDEKNQELIEELKENGVKIQNFQADTTDELEDEVFVFTGTLEDFTRDEAQREVRERGGDPASSVSSNTDYVVVGDNPGSKYEKAKELDIEILNEEEFKELIS
ncbi:MAG: NAD-dependent DNA ligase LigA [Candidatus Magasanikbacteria bacterium]